MGECPVYHERQRLELCAIHALNNLLQRAEITQRRAEEICWGLSLNSVINPHRSFFGTVPYRCRTGEAEQLHYFPIHLSGHVIRNMISQMTWKVLKFLGQKVLHPLSSSSLRSGPVSFLSCTDHIGQSRKSEGGFLPDDNYDVNVIMAALQTLDYAAVWWDKRRSLDSLALLPSPISLEFLCLPITRKPWIAVRRRGVYYNLDSKLKSPSRLGGPQDLRDCLQGCISRESFVSRWSHIIRRLVTGLGPESHFTL
ncbi:LOW QUALITY PROTEIN: josephin-2-like [Anomaloglossus baeobatrachus]